MHLPICPSTLVSNEHISGFAVKIFLYLFGQKTKCGRTSDKGRISSRTWMLIDDTQGLQVTGV
jgi:hypothetical protein